MVKRVVVKCRRNDSLLRADKTINATRPRVCLCQTHPAHLLPLVQRRRAHSPALANTAQKAFRPSINREANASGEVGATELRKISHNTRITLTFVLSNQFPTPMSPFSPLW